MERISVTRHKSNVRCQGARAEPSMTENLAQSEIGQRTLAMLDFLCQPLRSKSPTALSLSGLAISEC